MALEKWRRPSSVVYLTTLTRFQTIQRRMIGYFMKWKGCQRKGRCQIWVTVRQFGWMDVGKSQAT
jgi:hypothetical protein